MAAIERQIRVLVDQVKAHRKALVDVEPVDAGGQTVLNALDTLLEIQEHELGAHLKKLIATRRRAADAEVMATLEERHPGRKRYRKH